MDRNEVKEDFLKHVTEHKMEIKHDDGVYRHLTFTRNRSNVYRFDLITYPGHLVISGDMGTYVFQRLHDMFEFFRDGIRDDDISINPGYWGEKLEAQDQQSGYKEWSKEMFEEIVTELYDTHVEEEELSREAAEDLWREIEDELFYYADTEEKAYEKAADFQYEGFELQDFWEYNTRAYTFHYLWILFAIVWGIKQYDNK